MRRILANQTPASRSVRPCDRMPSTVATVARSGSTIRSSTSKSTTAPARRARPTTRSTSGPQTVRHRSTTSALSTAPRRASEASGTARTVACSPESPDGLGEAHDPVLVPRRVRLAGDEHHADGCAADRPTGQGTRPPALALAADEVVAERVEPDPAHVGVVGEVPGRIEEGAGVPALAGPVLEVVQEGIEAGGGDVGVGREVPGGGEHRVGVTTLPGAVDGVVPHGLDMGRTPRRGRRVRYQSASNRPAARTASHGVPTHHASPSLGAGERRRATMRSRRRHRRSDGPRPRPTAALNASRPPLSTGRTVVSPSARRSPPAWLP